MTTTAKIAAKGTKGTGITPQLAAALHDNLGKTVVAIIELRSESRGENLKGDETVNLAIQTLEVIPEDIGAAEHVRELAKVAHYNRKVAEDGPKLPVPGDSVEPKFEDVLAAGAALTPHEYVESGDGEPGTTCNVCGTADSEPCHEIDLFYLTDDQGDDEGEGNEGEEGSNDPGESGGLADLDTEPHDDEDNAEPAGVTGIGSPFEVNA
jgi:hypothetical protein